MDYPKRRMNKISLNNETVARLVSTLVIALGALMLLFLVTGIRFNVDFLPLPEYLNFFSAFSYILSGLSLLTLTRPRLSGSGRRVAMILAGLVSFIAAVSTFGFLFGFNLHVAREFGGPSLNGWEEPRYFLLQPLTAFAFLFAGLSLMLHSRPRLSKNYHIANFIVSTLVATLGALGLVSAVSPRLFGFGHQGLIAMTDSSSAAFLLMGVVLVIRTFKRIRNLWTLDGRFVLRLTAGVVLLFFMSVFSFLGIPQLIVATEINERNVHEELKGYRELIYNLDNAETYRNAYLINGNKASLAIYRNSMNNVNRYLSKLSVYTRSNHEHDRMLMILRIMVHAKINEFDRYIRLIPEEGNEKTAEAYSRALSSGLGQIRGIVGLLEKESINNMRRQEAESGKFIDMMRFSLPAGTLIGFILISYAFFSLSTEIEIRKSAENALRANHDELESLFENSITADFLSTPKGKLIRCNKAFLRLFEFNSKEEAVAFPTEKLFADFRIHDVLVKRLVKEKTLGKVDLELYSSGGRKISAYVNVTGVFDETGRMKLMRGYILDTTKFKEVESGLRKLSAVVEKGPVAVVITNPAGDIEYVNDRFVQMTGYSMDEVVGKSPRILKSGCQSDVFYKRLWETISKGELWKGDMLNVKKNGELYWESALISPILDESGTITHYVAVKEDITEKKQLFDELVLAKEKAEENDRLKSAFLANISHEIRTPMNGILGFADLLKNPRLSQEAKEEYLQVLERSGNRMLNIINELIDISVIESGQLKVYIREINVREQLNYIHSFFAPEASRKGINLILDEASANYNLIISTDKEKFNSILMNLIKNAIKFTREGSIEFGYRLNGEFLVFYVKDTGIGFSMDKAKAIFDRFVQVDHSLARSYEGAGLGLSISKAYAEKLGGHIRVNSAPGEGSQFYVTLPMRTGTEKKPGLKESAEQKTGAASNLS